MSIHSDNGTDLFREIYRNRPPNSLIYQELFVRWTPYESFVAKTRLAKAYIEKLIMEDQLTFKVGACSGNIYIDAESDLAKHLLNVRFWKNTASAEPSVM